MEIMHSYFGGVGKHLILDSYLVKGFLVNPLLIDLVSDEELDNVVRLAFFYDQEELQQDKAEFSNKLKYRNEIIQHQWELRLLLLRRLTITPKYEELVLGIANTLGQFLGQLKQFLANKCDVEFFKSDSDQEKLEQRPTLELDPGSHWPLQESLEFFLSNNLESFRA